MEKTDSSGRFAYYMETLHRKLLVKTAGRILIINILVIIFFGSFLLLVFERRTNPEIRNYGDALWLMIITLATVGYGDITPITVGGRLVIVGAMLLGIGTLSAFITTSAKKRVQKRVRRFSGLDTVTRSENHVVVCGFNSRGNYVLSMLKEELKGSNKKIILLCEREANPIDDDDIIYINGSPSNEQDIKRANIAKAKSVVLLADDAKGGSDDDMDARTVLAALNISSENPEVHMTAEAMKPANAYHLQLAGVVEILDSNMLLGNLIARSAIHYGLINLVSKLVTREAGTKVSVIKVSGKMIGMNHHEIASYVQDRYNANLVAVIDQTASMLSDPEYRLQYGDRLLVLSQEEIPSGQVEQG